MHERALLLSSSKTDLKAAGYNMGSTVIVHLATSLTSCLTRIDPYGHGSCTKMTGSGSLYPLSSSLPRPVWYCICQQRTRPAILRDAGQPPPHHDARPPPYAALISTVCPDEPTSMVAARMPRNNEPLLAAMTIILSEACARAELGVGQRSSWNAHRPNMSRIGHL
jgi:hypothetical protein